MIGHPAGEHKHAWDYVRDDMRKSANHGLRPASNTPRQDNLPEDEVGFGRWVEPPRARRPTNVFHTGGARRL